MYNFAIIIFILTSIGFGTGIWLNYRRMFGAKNFILLGMALFFGALFNVIHKLIPFGSELIPVCASYFSTTLASAALLYFVLDYSNNENWLSKTQKYWVIIVPFVVQAIFGVIFFESTIFSSREAWLGEIDLLSLFVWLNQFYSSILLIISIVSISGRLQNDTHSTRLPTTIIFVGILPPLFFNLTNISDNLDSILIRLASFSITEFLIIYILFSSRNLETYPITRKRVIDKINDGWVIIDQEKVIVDVNPIAESIIGIPRTLLLGNSAMSVFENSPNIVSRIGDFSEFEFKGSVNLEDGLHFLNIRLLPIKSDGESHLGQLILWRDITDRRRVEEARQQARDEMFSLLHSISGAASRTENLNEFLTASLYQLVYTFQIQTGFIFLVHGDQLRSKNQRLLLVSHFGIQLQYEEGMASIVDDDLITRLKTTTSPIIIDDTSSDTRIPQPIKNAVKGTLIFIPMITNEEFTGVIGLVREKKTFESNEITRLSIAVEQISNFIYHDRRKQVALALAERSRLVRDLHDSVSQKLYGLVTLTEAAQAGIEAGAYNIPGDLVSKLGENARQALREMRLFLHELQPTHLEKAGLVTVLHKRLEAVEGHADIQTRFLTDDNINLDLDKEVALYYIAQEALNNILKHANATSVIVTLKQGRTNIKLEITDNGRGFDPKFVSKAGLGLRNMRERTAQIDGKFRLTSSPGNGTRITVLLKKERNTNSNNKRRQP